MKGVIKKPSSHKIKRITAMITSILSIFYLLLLIVTFPNR
jgi:hypothetical protein